MVVVKEEAPMNRPGNTTTDRAPTGPPLGVLALISTALLVAGVGGGAAVAGRPYPSPFADPEAIQQFFATQAVATTVNAVAVFGSAVPLLIYAATVSARLRQLGVTAPGAVIALAGGVAAAVLLALSGLLQWTLARPAVVEARPLVRALHDLSFLTGGPAHVVFLGLLVAGVAVPGLLLGLLPRPLAVAGLVIAALCELSTLALIWPTLAVLVPIGRFPALAWLVAAGFLLPRRRRREHPDRAQPSPSSPGRSAKESST
jgi:hypothetical protein